MKKCTDISSSHVTSCGPALLPVFLSSYTDESTCTTQTRPKSGARRCRRQIAVLFRAFHDDPFVRTEQGLDLLGVHSADG
jgi:hypothetical protein